MKLLVAITTYNGPERIFAVWRSFQTFPPTNECEFLVVDDGSDGHHMPNSIAYAAKSVGMSYIQHKNDVTGHPHNKGIPAAWNTACEFALTKGYSHALILNDDIELLPGAVDAAVYFATKNSDIAVVGISALSPSMSGMVPDWPQSFSRTKPVLLYYAKGCSFVIDLNIWKQLNGFDTWFISHFEDVDYGLRAIEKGKLNVAIPQLVLHGWSKTFASNPHLQGNLRLEVSRVLFKKKWGRAPSEFPLPTCMHDGRIFHYHDVNGQPQSGTLSYAKFGAVQE